MGAKRGGEPPPGGYGYRDPAPPEKPRASSLWPGRRVFIGVSVILALVLGIRFVRMIALRAEPLDHGKAAPASAVPSDVAARTPMAGPPAVSLAALAETPPSIAVDATSLYWTESGVVMRSDKSGASRAALVDKSSVATRATKLTLDDDSVYWLTQDSGDAAGGSRVMQSAKTGGAAKALATEPMSAALSLATDGASVYFTLAGRATAARDGGSLKRVAKGGGDAVVLAKGLSSPCAVAVDDRNAYWVSGTSGSVWKIAKTGGEPINLAVGHGAASCAVGLDATGVYWVERLELPGLATSTLRKVPKVGGEVSMVAFEQLVMWNLVVDDGFVYFLALPTEGSAKQSEGGLWRAPTQHFSAADYLAHDRGAPASLAVDAKNVYWTGKGEGEDGIWRLPKAR